MNLGLIEILGYGRCQLCGTFFRLSDLPKKNRWSNVSRESLSKAIKKEGGLIFWSRELDARKRKAGVIQSERDCTYERRFLCPDCVWFVLADVRGAQ